MISNNYRNSDPLEPDLNVPKQHFSQLKEDQLHISKKKPQKKTAYVSCSNEAADAETSDTRI